MIDALAHSLGKARGVATVRRDTQRCRITCAARGGRARVRFNFVKRLVDFTPRAELMEIAGRIAKLGWHVVIYFEASTCRSCGISLPRCRTWSSSSHGRPDVSKPVDGPEFELFMKFMAQHPNVWSKVSCPERLSVSGPPALNGEQNPYRDVIPFARRNCRDVSGSRALGHRLAASQSQGSHA